MAGDLPAKRSPVGLLLNSRIVRLFALLLSVFGSRVEAQDRVTFRTETMGSAITVSGIVLDFRGAELRIQTANGTTQRIASSHIKGVSTTYNSAHLKGLELANQFQNEAALKSLTDALPSEHRDWVIREIRAKMVQLHLRVQNLSGAIREFRQILVQDPETRHWNIAPLIWTPQVISDSLRHEMLTLLGGTDPADQLLAASVLLLDVVQGEEAERKLQSLSRHLNPVVVQYSRAQLWRVDIASRRVNEITIKRWQDQLDLIPVNLKSGPQYLLARGYEVQGELRQAATEALWVPFVYSENEIVSARALLEAAENLQRSGLSKESKVLYRELSQKYPWSSEARQALTHLKDDFSPATATPDSAERSAVP